MNKSTLTVLAMMVVSALANAQQAPTNAQAIGFKNDPASMAERVYLVSTTPVDVGEPIWLVNSGPVSTVGAERERWERAESDHFVIVNDSRALNCSEPWTFDRDMKRLKEPVLSLSDEANKQQIVHGRAVHAAGTWTGLKTCAGLTADAGGFVRYNGKVLVIID